MITGRLSGKWGTEEKADFMHIEPVDQSFKYGLKTKPGGNLSL